MRIVLLLLCIMSTAVCGFADTLYDRLILGSDILSDVKRVCQVSKDPKDYDALYPRVLALPMPLLVRAFDKAYSLFEPSKEAKLATMWRETGALINGVLYSLIAQTPSPVSAMAVWHDPAVQAKLSAIADKQEVEAFNTRMEQLKVIHQKIDAKMKVPGFWYKNQVFKGSESELEHLLTASLDVLMEIRLIINRIAPADGPHAPMFKFFIPSLLRAVKGMQEMYQALDFIHVSSVRQWYDDLRVRRLTGAIKRCMPPLLPLSESY